MHGDNEFGQVLFCQLAVDLPPRERVQFVRENPVGPSITESGRRRGLPVAAGGMETLQV
jgi:hypothetical protein